MDEKDNTPAEEFENIVSSVELDVSEAPPGGLWTAVGNVWGDVMPGHVLSKGIIIVEYIGPEGRQLRWESANGMAEWDVLGMLRSSLLDVESQNLVMQLQYPVLEEPLMNDIDDDDSDDFDDGDDEQ